MPLKITIPGGEQFNSKTNEFITIEGKTLTLEHSLISVSKWESKWQKAFLGRQEKTQEQILDYIRCMTLTPNVDPNLYLMLTQDNITAITNYINSPMTATWFSEDRNSKPSREIITSELIYYWMIANQIPWDCEKWHLNRLMTLIRVCSIKNAPPKKMSRNQIVSRNTALNAARRKALNTTG